MEVVHNYTTLKQQMTNRTLTIETNTKCVNLFFKILELKSPTSIEYLLLKCMITNGFVLFPSFYIYYIHFEYTLKT